MEDQKSRTGFADVPMTCGSGREVPRDARKNSGSRRSPFSRKRTCKAPVPQAKALPIRTAADECDEPRGPNIEPRLLGRGRKASYRQQRAGLRASGASGKVADAECPDITRVHVANSADTDGSSQNPTGSAVGRRRDSNGETCEGT